MRRFTITIFITGTRMFPIDGRGHDDNQFTAGDIERGIEPTTMTPEWANDVQNELLNLIKDCGIDPSKLNQHQLKEAVKKISGYDFICRKEDDLEKILDTELPAGFRIRVDTNQSLSQAFEITADQVVIESKVMGIKLSKKSELDKVLPVDYPFISSGNFLKISGFMLEDFKYAVKFQSGLLGAELTKIFINSSPRDADLPMYTGNQPSFFISSDNFRAGE